MVAEAVAHAAEDGALSGDASVDEAFSRYLSKDHVEHPEEGCVIAALGFEGARQRGPVRRAFAEAARGLLGRVELKLHPRSDRGSLSDEALATASRMVGAVVLARLVGDEAFANRLLASARHGVGVGRRGA